MQQFWQRLLELKMCWKNLVGNHFGSHRWCGEWYTVISKNDSNNRGIGGSQNVIPRTRKQRGVIWKTTAATKTCVSNLPFVLTVLTAKLNELAPWKMHHQTPEKNDVWRKTNWMDERMELMETLLKVHLRGFVR